MQVSNISFRGLFSPKYEGRYLDKSKSVKQRQKTGGQKANARGYSLESQSSQKAVTHVSGGAYKSNTASRVPSYYDAPVYIPKRELETYTGQEFIKNGGQLYFDRAVMNGSRYNHSITTSNDVLNISTSYDKGIKDFTFVFLHDGCDNVSIFTGIEKVDEVSLEDGGKTIYYEDYSKNCKYIEDYNGEGRLEYATLERYDDGAQDSANKGKFISRTIAKFDETGTHIVETDVKIGDEYRKKAGFATRKTTFDDDGRKVTEEKTNTRKDNVLIGRSIVTYNKNGIRASAEDYNCKFYYDKNSKSPYASCDRRITSKKDGKMNVLYENYKTLDYTNGVNFLRGLIYDEHPCTVKLDEGDNKETYFDSIKQEAYAIETYDDKGLLVSVENLDNNTVTNIDYPFSNVIFLKQADGLGRKLSDTWISIRNEQLFVSKVDKYEPITGKRLSSTRYKPGGLEEKFEYARLGQPDRITLSKNGFVYSITETKSGVIKRTLFSETGEKACIEKDSKTAVKSVYDREGKVIYVDKFEGNLAKSRTLYRDGKPDEEIPCENGYPLLGSIEDRIVLNMEAI